MTTWQILGARPTRLLYWRRVTDWQQEQRATGLPLLLLTIFFAKADFQCIRERHFYCSGVADNSLRAFAITVYPRTLG
jgi:hypothetical protein